MNARIVKEVKRSNGLWRFACGDVFNLFYPLKENPGRHLKANMGKVFPQLSFLNSKKNPGIRGDIWRPIWRKLFHSYHFLILRRIQGGVVFKVTVVFKSSTQWQRGWELMSVYLLHTNLLTIYLNFLFDFHFSFESFDKWILICFFWPFPLTVFMFHILLKHLLFKCALQSVDFLFQL